MPELHRGQLQAIATYVNELVVNAPSKLFELTFGPALQNLESQFVRVSPWRELFDEYDFLSILHHCFAKFKEKLAGEYQGPIVGSEFEGLIPEIVAALSAYLASLPKAYDVFFELPSFPKYQVPEIRLSDTLSLIDTSAENHNEIKAFKGLLGVFADENNREPRLKRDSVYLRCRIDGYANGSINSYAIARALSLLKQFVFLGLQKKVLLKKGIADLFVENMYPHLPRTVDAVVWSAQDVFNEACRIKVPQDFSLYLYWIRINEEELRCHDGNSAASV